MTKPPNTPPRYSVGNQNTNLRHRRTCQKHTLFVLCYPPFFRNQLFGCSARKKGLIQTIEKIFNKNATKLRGVKIIIHVAWKRRATNDSLSKMVKQLMDLRRQIIYKFEKQISQIDFAMTVCVQLH